MDVKTHLKQICNFEQTLNETEMKIPKHKRKKAETEEKIATKRTVIESNISERQQQISTLASCIRSKSNFTFAGTKKEKKTTTIVCLATAIIQAIITAIMVACFGADNYGAVSIAYTVIYAVFIALWLWLEYNAWLKFPVFKTILGAAILVVLYQITYWYFKTCNGFNINIIGANVIFTLLIIAVEIYFGVRACNRSIQTQREAYTENKKWLQEAEVRLKKLQNELKLSKQELSNFNTNAAAALSKMEADITSLERYAATIRKTLQGLYAQNVLHPNYQNWVAAATIYEYLDVGRCYELKGPDGAYNLYERELIAKKILDSLSALNSSINYQGSRIYNSQTYIRSQLSECNRNVEQIVINTYGF